jgi:hypothetical protein
MRRVFTFGLSGVLGSALFSTIAVAAIRNPADYPLRVHIFQFNSHSHYYHPGGGFTNSLDAVDGEGRANLFEKGQPRGFDFSYSCTQRLMVSPGYETYLARWKKQDRELEVLLPELGGKPGETYSCDLKVSLKDATVYIRHNGLLSEEPASDFKKWMDAHQYDPENGKNTPVKPPAAEADAGTPAPAGNGNSPNSQP